MRALWAFAVGLFLGCTVAHGETVWGWIEGGPLKLTAAELGELKSTPLFSKRMGRIRLNLNGWKFKHGDFSDPMDIGKTHVEKRMQGDFVEFMKEYVPASGIFPEEVKERIAIQVTLLGLTHQSSVGSSAENSNPVTSGAVMTTQLSLKYELMDRDTVLGAWEVTTRAQSNGIQGGTRLADSTDAAMTRNLRSFLLRLIADLDAKNAGRAKAAIAALGAETDNTRGLLGYVVVGVGKTATTTADIATGAIKVLAENADAISAGMQDMQAQQEKFDRDIEQTYLEAMLASRQTSLAAYEARAHAHAESAQRSTGRVDKIAAAPAAGQQAPVEKKMTLVTPTVTFSNPDKAPCPPGSTWYNPETGIGAPGGTCYRNPSAAGSAVGAAATGSGGAAAASSSAAAQRASAERQSSEGGEKEKKGGKKIEWGPVQLEAIAICRQSPQNKKWRCSGALDDEILYDSPTLEASLARQHCAGGTWAVGGPVLNGVQWEAYRCGHGLAGGDYDVVKMHHLTTGRRSFMCPKHEPSDGRCDVFYDGQDRR